MDLERAHLSKVDSVDIIDYVKKSVEILMSMREDEFANYNKNWQIQEKIRENKAKLQQQEKETQSQPKTYKTPKNSRFFAKIRKETEMLITPKTNKKRIFLKNNSEGRKDADEDDFPVEYEVCL